MPDFHMHGRAIASVFDLLGARETSLTAAVGFACSRSATLRDALVADALGRPHPTAAVAIEQHGQDSLDRTDIELADDDGPVVIIEAKRGWTVPTHDQLARYAVRRPHIITVVTDCTDAYATGLGLPDQIDGVPVTHRSWRHLLNVVRGVGRSRWATELRTYLESTVATLQDTATNEVFVVVVGKIPEFNNQHGREFVDAGWYFHPHRPGWPQRPPTYIGFRQDNALFTVRHIDEYELVADLRDVADQVGVRHIDDTVQGPHFVYRLGPHIGPPQPLHAGPGRNFRNQQHKIPLDLLFTSPTYADAVEAAARRREIVG